MMNRHERITRIIELLQSGPQTVKSIQEEFASLGIRLTPRQIREDIKVIRATKYSEDARFERTVRANQKVWQIRPDTYTRNSQRLIWGVLPQVFATRRQESITKAMDSPLEQDPLITSTHFYETEAHQQLDAGLETVIEAIDGKRKMILTDLKGDATSVRELIHFPLQILPIKIIYHRGCFYLAAVADQTQRVLTFQIDQMVVEPSFERFDPQGYPNLVEADLRKRFGITQNIDDEVYEICLRFSSITGAFVKNQFWHTDLADPVRDGDNWLFTFPCGINRELVGWLFQWMSNVKVIGPPRLKELYDEQLRRMLAAKDLQPDQPLEFSNAFAPVL